MFYGQATYDKLFMWLSTVSPVLWWLSVHYKGDTKEILIIFLGKSLCNLSDSMRTGKSTLEV